MADNVGQTLNLVILDEFPGCDNPPTCLNGGYVSVLDGRCQCMCPDGLDIATNCATEWIPPSCKYNVILELPLETN